MSLRVLHILGELRPSGAERMLVAAASEFARLQVAGEVLGTGERPGEYARAMEAAGFRVHHVPFRKSPAFFWKVWKLARGGFDAIHIHSERAAFWYALVALATGATVVVKTVHANFDFVGGLRTRRRIQRMLMAWLGVHSVAISKAVQRNELARFGVSTELIPNWYDNNLFSLLGNQERAQTRSRLGVPGDRFVIVTVGNCSELKNHALLLRALALLPADERPLYLHAGEETYGQGERELAHSLGLGDDVRFLGGVANVREILACADAFVMPSLMEGFGVAAVEALASGLPTILSDVGGLSDLRQWFRGIAFAKPTDESLANAIHKVVREPVDARRALGQFNSQAAREHFSISSGARAYAMAYRGEERAGSQANLDPSGSSDDHV